MKLFSLTGKHVYGKTRYVDMPDGTRHIYRKYGLFDHWRYEGWYDPTLSKSFEVTENVEQ